MSAEQMTALVDHIAWAIVGVIVVFFFCREAFK